MITHSNMTAIITHFVGPTNTKGSRIIAAASMGRKVTIPYDHTLKSEEAHSAAAQALCDKFNWAGDLRAGGTETGYVFVFVER
jgi:hypothetical protein